MLVEERLFKKLQNALKVLNTLKENSVNIDANGVIPLPAGTLDLYPDILWVMRALRRKNYGS